MPRTPSIALARSRIARRSPQRVVDELDGATTPPDPTADLPADQRDATEETLANGTVLTTYNEQPGPRVVDQLPEPDDHWPLDPQLHRAPRGNSPDRWEKITR